MQSFSELSGGHWQAFSILIGAALAGYVLASLVVVGFSRWAGKTSSRIDDAIVHHLRRALRWLGPIAALRIALPYVELGRWRSPVQHGALVLVIGAAGWVLSRAVRVLEDVTADRVRDDESVHARAARTRMRGLRNVADFVITVVTLGFVLTTFEAVRQVGTGLLASAGVAGVVVGFAAQKSLATLLAGLQLTLGQRLRVDNVVIIEGEWGTIEEIRLTYVVMKIWDKRRLIIPATYFIEKPFQNWTRSSPDLLGIVELHLDYSVPVEPIRDELKRICEASEHWDGESCGVVVTGSTERSMIVRPLISAKDSGDQWNLRCEVREKLIAFVQKNYPNSLPKLRAEVRDVA